MFKFIHSTRLKLAATLASVLLASCGGGGSATSPPASGVQLDPGDGQITVRWAADAGVEYWLGYLAGTSVSLAYGAPHTWFINVTSPYIMSGLTNGSPYAFSVNGRTDGGPGGAGTPSVYDTPRPGGVTWHTGTAMGTSAMRAVAYGIATDTTVNYVAVGDAGAIYKGTNGITWTAVTTGPASSTVDFRAATYAFTRFIAAGTSGKIFYSPDMATWTAATSTTTNNVNALASNGTIAVAVGANGTIQYSADGITWVAAATVPTTKNLNGVTYGASGVWLAAGDNGTLLTSTDGSTWTAQTNITPAVTANLNAVAVQYTALTATYTYVAVGAGGVVVKSNDALTWTSASVSPAAGLSALVVPSTNSQFLAVGLGGAAFTSPDGITWTARATGTTTGLVGLTFANAQYIAVAANGVNINSH
jgi:hypothetical protein